MYQQEGKKEPIVSWFVSVWKRELLFKGVLRGSRVHIVIKDDDKLFFVVINCQLKSLNEM